MPLGLSVSEDEAAQTASSSGHHREERNGDAGDHQPQAERAAGEDGFGSGTAAGGSGLAGRVLGHEDHLPVDVSPAHAPVRPYGPSPPR